jgi:hypothetical protein
VPAGAGTAAAVVPDMLLAWRLPGWLLLLLLPAW